MPRNLLPFAARFRDEGPGSRHGLALARDDLGAELHERAGADGDDHRGVGVHLGREQARVHDDRAGAVLEVLGGVVGADAAEIAQDDPTTLPICITLVEFDFRITSSPLRNSRKMKYGRPPAAAAEALNRLIG